MIILTGLRLGGGAEVVNKKKESENIDQQVGIARRANFDEPDIAKAVRNVLDSPAPTSKFRPLHKCVSKIKASDVDGFQE